jgi:ribosomal protein S18 acetylase RimI-like enzyme
MSADDIGPLAAGLAELPLMQRYGRSRATLTADLERALERGDGLSVYDSGAGATGLAWFLTSGTFALGGYLKLIAVTRAAQQRGVGRELLATFEQATRAHSKHAYLLVSDCNEGAQRFYERAGYQRVGRVPGLILPDVAELIYWKRLTST